VIGACACNVRKPGGGSHRASEEGILGKVLITVSK
jgi:hypothetical protein